MNKHFRNLESAELPVYSVKAHKEIINCLDGVGGAGIGEGAPEIVTGSRDGTLTNSGPLILFLNCLMHTSIFFL